MHRTQIMAIITQCMLRVGMSMMIFFSFLFSLLLSVYFLLSRGTLMQLFHFITYLLTFISASLFQCGNLSTAFSNSHSLASSNHSRSPTYFNSTTTDIHLSPSVSFSLHFSLPIFLALTQTPGSSTPTPLPCRLSPNQHAASPVLPAGCPSFPITVATVAAGSGTHRSTE